jgi:hypothetical protein
MTSEEIRVRTQDAWDRFYSWKQVWARSSAVSTIKARVAFVLISKLYRQMYANTGIATDSARVQRSTRWANLLGRGCRRLFLAPPMPELAMPEFPMSDHPASPADLQIMPLIMMGQRRESSSSLTGRPN